MVRIVLAIVVVAVFSFPAASQVEVPPIVGKTAELILKSGDILETTCGTKYKRRWKFCTSVVNVHKAHDEMREYVGAWHCMRYLNDNGDHLNIVCRREGRDP